MTILPVNTPSRNYSVIISPGALERLGTAVREVAPSRRAMLVLDRNLLTSHGQVARQVLEAAGYDVECHTLVADERQKSFEVVGQLHRVMLDHRMERRDPLVALGGGLSAMSQDSPRPRGCAGYR